MQTLFDDKGQKRDQNRLNFVICFLYGLQLASVVVTLNAVPRMLIFKQLCSLPNKLKLTLHSGNKLLLRVPAYKSKVLQYRNAGRSTQHWLKIKKKLNLKKISHDKND